MSRYQPFHISFFGGLNEDENPDAVGDAELTEATNVWRRGRTTGTRPGTKVEPELYPVAIATNPKIVGIHDYRYDRDTSRHLVVMTPNIIHHADGAGDVVTQGVGVVVTNAAEKPWTFAQHKDILYAAGGDVTAVAQDLPWYWDGSNDAELLSIPNLNSENLSPRWIFEWNNRLYAGGFPEATTPDNTGGPGIVRFSALNQGSVWPERNTFGGFSAVGGLSSSGAEYVTGGNSYRDNRGDFLLVTTNRFVYAYKLTGDPYSPHQLTDVTPNGCVAHHAWINLGLDAGDGLYMSEQGIHSLRQSQQYGEKEDAFLSYKIRHTFASINKARLDQVQGAVWRERGSAIWAVPTNTSTTNDTILELSLRDVSSGSQLEPGKDLTAENAVWHVWKLSGTSHYCNALTSGQDSSGDWRIYGGNGNGQVFEFTESVYSDLGNPYTVQFATKHHHFNTPFYRKMVGDTLVDLQPGGDQRPLCQVLFDYGRSAGRAKPMVMATANVNWGPSGTMIWNQTKWGGATKQKQSRIYMTGSGDTLAWRFTHSGTNEPFFVARLSAEVAQMGDAAQG